MEPPRGKRGRCRCALGLALLFDALGLAGLLVGGLLETEVSDLLIYLGGVAAFFSLPWWVFWHVGNLEVAAEELRGDAGLGWRGADAWSLESGRARRLALLARAFSGPFSLPGSPPSASASAASAAAASAPSQAGRLRAHFAASATDGPGQGEKLPRPPRLQDAAAPAAAAAAASFSSSSSSSVAGTTAPPDSLEISETQEDATQSSFLKITGYHKKT